MNGLTLFIILILILLLIGLVTYLIISIVNSNKINIPVRTNTGNLLTASNGTGYSVEFLNNSGVDILLGALGPSIVLPREGTWILQNNGTLNIDIPQDWLNTAGHSELIGPRFWARTGCRYNIQDGKAQCETGGCGGAYDCSKNNLAGQIPVSLAEFCFQCGGGLTYYDVSLVDGYNLSINIEPIGGSSSNPNDPNDVFWCKTDTCNRGQDLRSICPQMNQLHSSDIPSYIPGQPNNMIACFSNCGLYEYPVAPSLNCTDDDPKCTNWRKYCCQASDFGKACSSDADCSYGGACWTGNDRPPSSTNPATCQCRAYYLSEPCSPNICTNPQAAPPVGICHSCIGDDKIHQICPRAYTWPNDPQTYDCDAKRYRITFSPGGTPVPVTSSIASIPKCSSLPTDTFDYQTFVRNCSQVKSKYACAVPKNSINPNWSCNVDPPNVGCNGVICERDVPTPPPVTIPNCNALPPEYNPFKGIQDCSIPNSGENKYNCAVTGTQNWACAIPSNYVCSGIVCKV
jgi:hypothetical protein